MGGTHYFHCKALHYEGFSKLDEVRRRYRTTAAGATVNAN
jgi:hypothetical protein